MFVSLKYEYNDMIFIRHVLFYKINYMLKFLKLNLKLHVLLVN